VPETGAPSRKRRGLVLSGGALIRSRPHLSIARALQSTRPGIVPARLEIR
jgi:hypothetical protein